MIYVSYCTNRKEKKDQKKIYKKTALQYSNLRKIRKITLARTLN